MMMYASFNRYTSGWVLFSVFPLDKHGTVSGVPFILSHFQFFLFACIHRWAIVNVSRCASSAGLAIHGDGVCRLLHWVT